MNLLGLIIGFYGYLFPGNINIMVMDLYSAKKYNVLIIILVLVLIFESAYCWVSLFYLNALKSNLRLFSLIKLISYLLVLVLGIWMILDRKITKKASQTRTLYRGVMSIIIHPQQIPFWVIVGVLLNPVMNFGVNLTATLGFVGCNALGTLLVMLLYMISGNRLMHYFKLKINQLNVAIGIFYVALALFSLSDFLINQ